MTSIVLRQATPEDAQRIFGWRNDPWIVSLSENQREVTWREHEAWFLQVLASSDHLVFTLEADGEGVGTIRLDRKDKNTAVLTVYLLKPWIGRGLGTQAIVRASSLCFERWSEVSAIEAHVRADNAPSLAAFAKAGFCAAPERSHAGAATVCLLLNRRKMGDIRHRL